MSELELSVLRQRWLEALKQRARRGELFMTVAIGYVHVGHDRIEKDPDRRIVEAIALFAKFAEVQSARQTLLWFRPERVPLPAVGSTGSCRYTRRSCTSYSATIWMRTLA